MTLTEPAIRNLREIEAERELTPAEEARLIGLLRCAKDEADEEELAPEGAE